MNNPFSAIKAFFAWWLVSLYSCLPATWVAFLSGERSKFDIVIAHRDNLLVALNNQGKVLDSVLLDEPSGIHLENLPDEDSRFGKISNTQLKAAEQLISKEDPLISLKLQSLDIDLTDHKDGSDPDRIDPVSDRTVIDLSEFTFPAKAKDRAYAVNVISLNHPGIEDARMIENEDDPTIHLRAPGKAEDTVIIKGDQDDLMQFGSGNQGNQGSKDSTILFRSYGGKIHQVDPEDVSETAAEEGDDKPGIQFGEMSRAHDPAAFGAVASLLEMYQGHKRALYLLPDSMVLMLNLSYPIEAMQNIESVLRYDLEKHIPLSNQEVRYFYALNVDANEEKVSAEVAVVKVEDYDLLSLSLEPFLKGGLLCTTQNFYRKYGSRINFLEQKSEQSWHSLVNVRSLHLVFNWLLICLLLAAPFWSFDQGLNTIGEKSAAEVNRVTQLVSELNSISAESDFGILLSDQVNKVPRSVELISVLSGSINKQAWLHQFNFSSNEIRIKGEAESATSVSDDLNSTGLFESIKFVSSIVKNARTGKESFELLLTLKPNA